MAPEHHPFDEQLRFRQAGLMARNGQMDEAVREWHLLVELNPHHMDAQRELHLQDVRRRKAALGQRVKFAS